MTTGLPSELSHLVLVNGRIGNKNYQTRNTNHVHLMEGENLYSATKNNLTKNFHLLDNAVQMYFCKKATN